MGRVGKGVLGLKRDWSCLVDVVDRVVVHVSPISVCSNGGSGHSRPQIH